MALPLPDLLTANEAIKNQDLATAYTNRAIYLEYKLQEIGWTAPPVYYQEHYKLRHLQSDFWQKAIELDSDNIHARLNLMMADWRTGKVLDHELLDRIHREINPINPVLAALTHILI